MFPDDIDWGVEDDFLASDFDDDFLDAVRDLELTASGWLWCTADGQELTLAEMETRHVFNVAKLFFNHLAEAHGGVPVWFTRPTSSLAAAAEEIAPKCAAVVVFLLDEVVRRGNLPVRFREPLSMMLAQISPVVLPGGRRMITPGNRIP